MCDDAKALTPKARALVDDFVSRMDGCTLVYVVADGHVELVLALADAIRAESHDAVRALQHLHLDTLMLTGDRTEAATRVCDELGIPTCHSALKPEDKLALIKSCELAGKSLMMIGDGMNDGPSLAAASVGVAMGASESHPFRCINDCLC